MEHEAFQRQVALVELVLLDLVMMLSIPVARAEQQGIILARVVQVVDRLG